MPKKPTSTCTIDSGSVGKMCAPLGASTKEPSVQTVFRSLLSKLAVTGYNHSTPPTQVPLVEMEHEGQIYSLFCRKKLACPAFVELSPREKDIARMIATGLPNKTIAAALEISEWTVSTHLRRIFAKLGVSCRAAMVSKWLESHARCQAGVLVDNLAPPRVSSSGLSLFENNGPPGGEAGIRMIEPAAHPQALRSDRNNCQEVQETRKPGTVMSKTRSSRTETVAR